MRPDKYNGWTNYETWNLKLWIDNDEGTSDYWNERAQECYDNAEADKTFTRLENAAFALKDELKNETENNTPEVTGFYADIMNAAISQVNFYEIAKAIIEDAGIAEDDTEDDNDGVGQPAHPPNYDEVV